MRASLKRETQVDTTSLVSQMPRKPEHSSGMFPETKTWNPFVGCRYKCVYCGPSFQAQLKRRGKEKDPDCYYYRPHTHAERLKRIPSTENVFVVGDGDISFCPPKYTRRIIERIKKHNVRFPEKKYLFQSKNPKYFEQFLDEFPSNVMLQTTLETNRDEGYESWSQAPKPSVRYKDFLSLDYPCDRKVVTIEPVMDFDVNVFCDWIKNIKPKYVWFGFNSKPRSRVLRERGFDKYEPSEGKAQQLVDCLENARIDIYKHNERARKHRGGIIVRGKELRGVKTRSEKDKRKNKSAD